MYDQYLQVQSSKKNIGRGVFTTVHIPKGVPILEVGGEVYTEETLPDPKHPAILQIGPNLFKGPSGNVSDYINHSCHPNCLMHTLGNRAILYSLYNIAANTELTFDYSTTSTDTLEKWKMECHCGHNNCRKVISGFQLLDKQTQQNLKDKGMVPLFLNQSIFISK